jgi:hypothetical protein
MHIPRISIPRWMELIRAYTHNGSQRVGSTLLMIDQNKISLINNFVLYSWSIINQINFH